MSQFNTIKSSFLSEQEKKQAHLSSISLAINQCGSTMAKGDKTHKKNEWRTGDKTNLANSHFSHAIGHLRRCYSRKTDEEIIQELSHAATRSLMSFSNIFISLLLVKT